MGIANRIINILVCLAAIGAVVLGVMLFNKREDVAKGREMMAKAIADNTAKLIAEQDEKNAKKLAVKEEQLGIDKPSADLVKPIKNFSDATKKVLNQRADLAQFVLDLTKEVSEGKNMEPFSPERLADYTLSADEKTKVSGRVAEKVQQSKNIRAAYVTSMKSLNDKMKMGELTVDAENPDINAMNDLVAKMGEKSVDLVNRNEAFGQHVKSVSSIFQIDEPPVDGADYASSLSEQRTKLEGKMQELNDLTHAKETLTAENKDLKEQTAKQAEELDTQKKLVAIREKEVETANAEIKRLRDIINPKKTAEGEQEVGQQLDSATTYSLLKQVQAKVLFANKELGFVVLDLGKVAQIETKDPKGAAVKKPVQIPPNAVMTATKSLDPAKAHFAGKIQIVNAGDKESIANILPSPSQTYPEVGDVVYFSANDLESVQAANEARLKEMQSKANQTTFTEEKQTDAAVDELLGSEDEEKAPAKKEAAPAKEEKEVEATDDDVL